MWMRWVVVMCAAIGMAACHTPYQPMGYRGGYEDTCSGATCVVTVRVRWRTTQGEAIVMANRRAGELCVGGYTPLEQMLNGRDQVTIVVRCAAAE